MNQIAKVACGLLLCALVVSCGGSTKMVGTWSDPSYQSDPIDKILVIGLGENVANVKMYEAAMAKQFKARKIEAVPGSTIFPVGAPIDTTAGRRYMQENGIDLVTVTRVLGLSTEQEYVPGSTYYTPAPAYYGFYPYYYTSYQMVSTPGYVRQYRVATVETNVYSIRNERLVWSGQSQTADPSSLNQGINDIAAVTVSEMAKSGLFGGKKK